MQSTDVVRTVPGKRELLARTLGRLGMLKALEYVATVCRPGLVVLTYHRIAEPATNPFYDPVISATPNAFRLQLDWLQSHVHLLSLDELIERLEHRSSWHGPAVMLTFDDAYRDNFDVAFPMLCDRHIPATFFIPTAFLETPQVPWWDQVAYILKTTQVRTIRLPYSPDPGSHTPALVADFAVISPSEAIATVIGAILDDRVPDVCWFLEQLRARAEISADNRELGQALFMNWDQIRRLACSNHGLSIGSHAHSHRKLATLDEDTQLQELTTSKRILEAYLGNRINALAYPYGWAGSYTARSKSLAAEAGYHLAFSSEPGLIRAVDLDCFSLRRLGVGVGDSAVLLRARMALYRLLGYSFL
jgi:peptidoglycan/xylan/chitin deacetylase (PgdA/CDA1 family)